MFQYWSWRKSMAAIPVRFQWKTWQKGWIKASDPSIPGFRRCWKETRSSRYTMERMEQWLRAVSMNRYPGSFKNRMGSNWSWRLWKKLALMETRASIRKSASCSEYFRSTWKRWGNLLTAGSPWDCLSSWRIINYILLRWYSAVFSFPTGKILLLHWLLTCVTFLFLS